MKKWAAAYGIWILGVLSAAAVAYWYYVKQLGQEAEE